MRGADLAGVRLGHGQHDVEERHADPVVETALDVEPLADPGREPRLGDHRLAQRRVGGSEHDRDHERLRDGERAEERRRDDGAQQDREREPDAEQAHGHRVLPSECPQVDPRRVGEQHDGEGGLGEELHRLPGGGHVEQVERLDSDQEPDRHEDHRGRDRGPVDAARDGAEPDQRDGDHGQGPFHETEPTTRIAAVRGPWARSPG